MLRIIFVIGIDSFLTLFHRVVCEQDVLSGSWRLFLEVGSKIETLQLLRVRELISLLLSLFRRGCHDPSGPSNHSAHFMEVLITATVSSLHN